jgi:hypothetical protein
MGAHDRIGKLMVDRGEAPNLEAAERILSGQPLQLLLGPEVPSSETMQICALLAADVGRRAFAAGVTVTLAADGPALTAAALPHVRLRAALEAVGARVGDRQEDLPTVGVGEVGPLPEGRPSVWAVPRGWSGGAVAAFLDRPQLRPGVLGAAAAASVAVSEVFLATYGGSARAGMRSVGISAWDPTLAWESPEAVGPDLVELPSKLWLLGLGHLGQAYGWILRTLPFNDPAAVLAYLQDDDRVETENFATQLLSDASTVGALKTRVVCQALESAGMDTRLFERRFDARQRRQPPEPVTALIGVDSDRVRRDLSRAGWKHVINAGLGARADTFTQVLVHRVEGDAAALFVERLADDHLERLLQLPAYQLADGDGCGAVVAAGRAVGTAFVGAAAAVMVLAELLRPLHDGPSSKIWQLNLRAPAQGAVTTLSYRAPDRPASAAARQLRESSW